MKFPSKEIVDAVRSAYPVGTQGTVTGVDDTAK